jgi:EmrB/QacA subfamily drug resistance transporter
MTPQHQARDEPTHVVDRDSRLRILIPVVVAIGFLMENLDSTILTTAIPDIARSLQIAPVRMSLAVSAYVLTLAVFIPVSGWFADRYGARRIFALALVLFTLGSALCGAANSFGFLVATRILQGFGGAMMTPVGRLILLRSFPRTQMLRAMTYVAYPAVLGPLMGPLVGGFIATHASWRWIFYVNIPFGLFGVALALRYVENFRAEVVTRFDFRGFALVGLGLALLQFGMENVGRATFPAAAVVGVLVASAVLLALFGWHQRRIESPAVDLGLFRVRSFAVGSLMGGICRVAMNSMGFLLPLLLQVGFGMTPIASGSISCVAIVGVFLTRPVLGRLLRRFGFKTILIASAVAGSGLLAGFALVGPNTPRLAIAIYVFFFGMATSFQYMTSNTLSYSDMPDSRLSRATSLGGVLQQLTVSFGVSLGAMLVQIVDRDGAPLTPHLFHEVFLVLAVLPWLALPGFLRLRAGDGAQVSGYKVSGYKRSPR